MGTYHKQLSQPDVLLRQADRLVERRFRPGFDGMTAEELFRQSDFCKG